MPAPARAGFNTEGNTTGVVTTLLFLFSSGICEEKAGGVHISGG